jgi:type I restriction enzyme S subunit
MRYDSFFNIIEDDTSRYHKIKKEDYQPFGLFPIIDQGQEFIGGYTDDENLIAKENLPVIIFGDHTKIFKYVDFPFTIGADGVKVLALKNQSFNTKFYYYFLRTLRLTNAGYSRHFKYLKVCKLPIPDNVDNQRQIANILTNAENLISQRKESISLLDEYLKSTFLEMFGDCTTNKMKWGKAELKHFGEIITGNTPPRNNPENYSSNFIEWIKTDNIPNENIYITKAAEYLSESGMKYARTVENGALLVACIAGSIQSVGRAALSNRKVSFNQQINAIQPNDEVEPLFLYWLFKISRKYVQAAASKGMKKILTKGDFEKIEMIKPPIKLQNQFAQIVEKTEALKVEYQRSLQELENLYASLSQKAFRGELNFKEEGLMIAAEPEEYDARVSRTVP